MVLIVLLLIAFVLLTVLYILIEMNQADEDLDDYDPHEYNRARLTYLQAQGNFDQADPQYIDVAISDLGVSENRVNNELRKIRIEDIRSSQDTLTWIALACDGDLQHRQPALNRMTATLEIAIYGYERLYA